MMWACFLFLIAACSTIAAAPSAESPKVYAVLVASSRYWFNYRHAMNALGIYEILKQNGVPDSQIILMIADEYAINPRNPYKNGMYASGIKNANWYTEHTEIDYRSGDVTVQNFLDAVAGVAPRSIQPKAGDKNNLLIYLTGHGGDQFFKFRDEEEITARDIANLMENLHKENKFQKTLLVADTCQAFTIFDKVETENVLALGTSLRGENAYAHHSDQDLGLSVIERWTLGFLNKYKGAPLTSDPSLEQLMVVPFRDKRTLGAHVGIKENSITFRDTTVSEFFGKRQTQRRYKKSALPSSVVSSETFTPYESVLKTTWNELFQHQLTIEDTRKGTPEMRTLSIQDFGGEPTDSSFILMVFGILCCLLFTNLIERKTKILR